MALTILKWLALTFVALTLLAVVAGQLGFLRGKAPDDLGVRDGRLKPPAKTPNSVSSQAALWPDHPRLAYASIPPLALRGDGVATLARIRSIVQSMPGAVVVSSGDDYLYAQFTTRLMKYTDDVEFWFDPAAGVVQLRSASRIGEGDFGANRKRIEAVRGELAQTSG